MYNPESRAQFRQVKQLSEQDRVQAYGPADYREGTHTYNWLTTTVEDIAMEIVRKREEALGDRVGRPPGHVLESSRSAETASPSPSEAPEEAATEKPLAGDESEGLA